MPRSVGLDLGQAITAGVVCCCICSGCTDASGKPQSPVRPIVVIVTNQSNSSQDVTFQTSVAGSGGKNEVTQSTGPINPGDTGQIKLDVVQGKYQVKTGDGAISPAAVSVGPKRASAQNDLLQP